MAAIRVKANYPAAQYRRLKPRRGHKRALGAVKHLTCSPAVLSGQAAGIRWVCPSSFQVAATSRGVR